jgi:hypothetical protein
MYFVANTLILPQKIAQQRYADEVSDTTMFNSSTKADNIRT